MGNSTLAALRAPAPHEDERLNPLYYDWSLPERSPFREQKEAAETASAKVKASQDVSSPSVANESSLASRQVTKTSAVSLAPPPPSSQLKGSPAQRQAQQARKVAPNNAQSRALKSAQQQAHGAQAAKKTANIQANNPAQD